MAASSSGPPAPQANPSERNSREDVPWWLYPALLVAAIVITAMLARRTHHVPDRSDAVGNRLDVARETWVPTEAPEGQTVSLEIDFGNGARRSFDALPWHEGMKVADVMRLARDFRPPIRFVQQGEGAEAFLQSLEGVEGAGDGRRNWLYRVNGELAGKSFGDYELQPGDEVTWTYEVGAL